VWGRPSPTTTIASVALFFSLTGAAFAVGRVTAVSADRQVTSAQLAEQRQVERSEHALWVTTEQQCSAKRIPDAQCNTDEIAPIGSGIVTCGSGGCFGFHGVPTWPDPVSGPDGKPSFDLVDTHPPIDSASPRFQRALHDCGHLVPHSLGGIRVRQQPTTGRPPGARSSRDRDRRHAVGARVMRDVTP
jgi:hypothetical protein